MSLTFYYLSGSPFSWRVWLALEHLAVPYDLRVLSIDAGDLKTPAFLGISPHAKAPAIVDDGFPLYESAAIVEYLADRYAQGGQSLWPAGQRARATARRIATEADSYIYPAVRRLVVEILMRRTGEPDVAAIIKSKTMLASEFARMEGELRDTFLAGNAPTAADFAPYPLSAILLRVHVRAPSHGLDEVFGPSVQFWHARVEALPYFAKTVPPHWRTT